MQYINGFMTQEDQNIMLTKHPTFKSPRYKATVIPGGAVVKINTMVTIIITQTDHMITFLTSILGRNFSMAMFRYTTVWVELLEAPLA